MPSFARAAARIGAYFPELWCSDACPRKSTSIFRGPVGSDFALVALVPAVAGVPAVAHAAAPVIASSERARRVARAANDHGTRRPGASRGSSTGVTSEGKGGPASTSSDHAISPHAAATAYNTNVR